MSDELVHGGELAATGARLCALGVLEAEDSDCGDGVPGLEGEGRGSAYEGGQGDDLVGVRWLVGRAGGGGSGDAKGSHWMKDAL